MHALRLVAPMDDRSPAPRGPVHAPLTLSADDRAVLRLVRRLARQAQLCGPIPVDHVCSLIEPASPQAYGVALMRTLDVVATRPMVFHPETAEEASFDELWLVRLLRCLRLGDTASARLLIDRRTGRFGRRAVAFLAQGFAGRLGTADLDASILEPF